LIKSRSLVRLIQKPPFSTSHTLPDRKKVLKHHPDKKAGLAGHSANDDAFFKCIQKAFEVLTNPTRKAQFDSIDPYYVSLEEDAPTAAQFKSHAKPAKSPDEERAREGEFFDAFGPVFEREARFSKTTPVLLLGSPDATKEQVEGFYDFWYNFDSWRSFEYLDKEVNEGSDRSVVSHCPSNKLKTIWQPR
jgi:DnaJ homolog subfamily C member 2